MLNACEYRNARLPSSGELCTDRKEYPLQHLAVVLQLRYRVKAELILNVLRLRKV